MTMRNVLGVVVIVLVTATTAAADPPDPAVVAAIKKIEPADYPSANTVTIVNDQHVVYQTDGKFTNTFHTVQMVLTPAGKQAAASRTLYYAKDAEKLEVLTAQVIKADGSVVPVPPADMKDTEQSGEMNIYDPNGRAIQVTVAGLAVGDAVDLTWKLERFAPTRENYFNDQFWFQATEPVLSATYLVDGPASMPLTTQIYHPERGSKITATKTKAGDRIRYTWKAKNAPQLIPESGMSFSMEIPTLVVTTDPSWKNFSKWWAELSEPKMKITDDLKAKVAELTKDAKTDDAKLKALYDFVAQDIRYRGLGVGPRTGYTPRSAHDTMTSRWGVCRDVSILLTAMLRETGIEAYPVLTNVGEPVRTKIAYDGFNHAIVAMPKAGGGWTYVDPTAKNNTAMLPGNEAEQDALVSTLKGEALGKIPAGNPAENLGHAKATTTIHADGSLTSKVVFETKGIFDLAIRGMVAMMSEKQQRAVVDQIIHGSLPDAQIVSYKTSNAMALYDPMTIEIEIEVPNAAPKTGDHRLLRTLVTSGALGLVESVLPQFLGGLDKRKFALDAQVTFQYDQTETVVLPPEMKIVALPNPAKSDTKVSSMTATCSNDKPTELKCHRSFALKTRFVDPLRYLELKSSLATLGKIARQPVIVEVK
jgi:transglutaminase-like putative cysteine protease